MRWLPWVPPLQRRLLLWALACSLLLPWLTGTAVKASMQAGLHDDALRAAQFVDILVIAVTVFLVITVSTVAIGCWVVAVMKGPVQRADAYAVDPLPEERR